MKKHFLPLAATLASLLFFCPKISFGQTQTLKGQIIDKAVRAELIGAVVEIWPQNNLEKAARKGMATDENGRFRFADLPVGKYALAVSFVGFENLTLQNVVVNAGKETDLTLELEEKIMTGAEAIVRATIEKEKPLNELSTVSTRTFSVDETRRYAAAFNDPGRMAASYAGVVASNDGNNTILIRGNAPGGLLWRMEGVEIPNPNHFSVVGSAGGGISIISAQLLSNSDFSTGAFAAEYGNATSGVFDLKLRKGNADKREFTVGAGVLGVDLAAEGPFRKLKNGGSYLINYRYSTLSLLAKLGVPLGDQVTNFQDLSFNFSMPAGRFGNFSLFGIGGKSDAAANGKADSLLWKTEDFQRYPFSFIANSGAVGLTNSKTWGASTFLKTIVSANATQNTTEADQFLKPDYALQREFETSATQRKMIVSSVLSHKFSARHFVRAGGYLTFWNFDFSQSDLDEETEKLVEQIAQNGKTQLAQAFAQWQYRPTERITFNAGLHGMGLFLNKSRSFEPRAALKYAFDGRQSISFGYGLHAQVQPIGAYFVKNESGERFNEDLDFSKSRHFVVGYDFLIRKNLRSKVEVYHQKLSKIPVSKAVRDSYSIINEQQAMPFFALENTGRGRNFGAELTLEKFLSRGFYFLLSSSWFRSEYRGSDGVWRSTRYDTRRSNVLTAGKEWDFEKRGKKRVLSLNAKAVSVGGQWETPIDLAASIAADQVVLNDSEAFSQQVSEYFRLDLGVRLTRNFRRVTTSVALDVQNVSNRKNVGGSFYDRENFAVKTYTQAPLLPILTYRLEF